MSYLDKITVGGTTYDVQDSAAVHFTEQSLTAAQQLQARGNVNAACETVMETITGNVPFDGTDGNATNRNCTVTRAGQRYTFSRTSAHSSNSDFSLMPKMHGANYSSTGANYATWCAEATLKLKAGQRYRLTARIVSGAFGSESDNSFTIYPKNEANTTLSNRPIILKLGRNTVDFIFSGTYFAVMCFVSSSFYTGDTPIVIDIALEEITNDRRVSGTDPVINADADTMYICGQCDTLNFTPCAKGVCGVRFESGTTQTVLTLPNTVKMPSWWTGVEASRIYEISIADGVYGVVTSWT